MDDRTPYFDSEFPPNCCEVCDAPVMVVKMVCIGMRGSVPACTLVCSETGVCTPDWRYRCKVHARPTDFDVESEEFDGIGGPVVEPDDPCPAGCNGKCLEAAWAAGTADSEESDSEKEEEESDEGEVEKKESEKP